MLMAALASTLSSAAVAQSALSGVPNAMQGFAQNRGQPVRIEATALDMRDKNQQATFTGGVRVVQGDTRMTSDSLVADYDKDAAVTSPNGPVRPLPAAPGRGPASSIHRLEAKGHVMVTQKDQVASGDQAVFDTRTNQIKMLGQVVLTQCQNVLRGDRLLVDMRTGVSRLEVDHGKVEALLAPPGQGCGAPAPAGGKTRKPGGLK